MKRSRKKDNSFKLIFHYLKEDKVKMILLVILMICNYIPDLCCPIFIGKALEFLLLKKYALFVKYLVLYFSGYVIVYGVLLIPRMILYNKLQMSFINKVCKDMYNKYQNLPAIAFEKAGVGELINRLSSDPDRVLDLLNQLVKMILKIIMALIIVVVSFKISIFIGIEITIFAIIMGIISSKYFPVIKNTQKEIKKESDKLIKRTTENLTGIREIKALGIKNNMINLINNDIDNYCNKSLKINRYESVYNGLNNIVYYVLQFIILLTCGYLFIKGHIVYSVLMMVHTYIWRIDEVAETLSSFGVNYNKVKVSLSRIDEVVNNKIFKDEIYGDINLNNPKGNVTFKNVSFKYTKKENLTLDNLSLNIKTNQKTAIVGRSGNGKTTIFNLLLRYFDVTNGEVLIDGVDIKDLSEDSLRKTISCVRQNPFLFNMSIFENFKIVKPDITLKEVKEVCKRAYIDEYIESLPKKYNTIIGEGGINLSGGQKQRLAIARTLLLNTKIILFDEATSALDNESQKYIKMSIDDLTKDHTIIIIAHRLSTIIDADEILVIENGKLESKGTHKELLKKSKVYKGLYENEERM
ncbi:aBC-type multidrug transport system ATPase and permease component [Mycoplasma sp. CAG:472]|nr:aBC-type multidrug transport system ATPase and permease component [Mycoplasma sp. CAG:472]